MKDPDEALIACTEGVEDWSGGTRIATALAAAGVKTPKDEPMDGKNLIPFLKGKEKGRPHEQLFWRSGRQHAARVGDWKLVRQRNRPPIESRGETRGR